MNKYVQIAILIILAAAVVYLIPHKAAAPAPIVSNPPSPVATPDVIVDTPQPNDLVTSPLTVKGRAMNSWYFEASLPGKLVDAANNVIVQKPFMAVTDWMTPGYVDFNETLTFSIPATQYGTLIISKDNPSGEPINDASFSVPVRFW